MIHQLKSVIVVIIVSLFYDDGARHKCAARHKRRLKSIVDRSS